MQNRKLVILIALSLIGVFSLTYGVLTPSKVRRQIILAQKGVSREAEIVKPVIPLGRDSARCNYVSWGRNPFVKREIPIRGFHNFNLNGIVWDEENPQAIINDYIVSIGDKIGEAFVIDIKKESVILNDGIKNFELKIEE